jgi:transposase
MVHRRAMRPHARLKTVVRRLRRHFDAIVASVELGRSNSRLEGLNAGIRLIQRRAHGYANLDNLIDMIYVCHGPIPAKQTAHTN